MKGSDLNITDSGSVRAHFQCDGDSVSVDFYYGENLVGTHDVYTRSEAVEVGERVAASGIYKNFPVPGVPLGDIKGFGARLRQYGENRC